MAAHIAIAKAAFGASLLRPDIPKVSRNDLPAFHDAFEAMLLQCSSRNVQTCKQWLVENVVVSPGRTAALGKYLVTISKHLAGQQDESTQTNPSRRQRLHILYLVNDLLHHGKYHVSDATLSNHLTHSLPPFLVELCRYAGQDARLRVSRRLSDLVELWKQEEYLGQEIIVQLQDALSGARHEPVSILEQPASRLEGETKELPYILPSTHGDASLPYYDLPAANLMPHIVPNSSQPMRPAELRALQLSAGPADETLVNALKNFLKDVEGIDRTLPGLGEAGLSTEVDELGQISYRDDAGDLFGDTYYGWSRAFCEKMKKRGRRGSSASSRRSRSRSTDRSRSVTPRKRRRRSRSSHGRSRSRSSYSRSHSRPRYHGRQGAGSQSTGSSRSRSRSYSPQYNPNLNRTQRVSGASTDSSTRIPPAGKPLVPPPPLPATPAAPISLPFPPPPPPPNFVPAGVPVPPPRPRNWVGQWPPPPPPPFPQGQPGYHNLPLAPPPPPPPNYTYPSGNWPAPGQNNRYSRDR